MKKYFKILAVMIAVAAIMFTLLALPSAAKPPKPAPECEVICYPMPPPIFVDCMIYCPPLEE